VVQLLITTGKNPDRLSRLIAHALFASIPGSDLEFRGKRSLLSLVLKARKKHYSRLCAIHKEEGKPSSLSFISLDDEGGWERLSPSIAIKNVSAAKSFPKKQSQCVEFSGAKKAVLGRLLDPRNSCGEPESKIIAGAAKISILYGRKKLLELGVAYAK